MFLPEITNKMEGNAVNNDEKLLNDFRRKTDFSLTTQIIAVPTALSRRVFIFYLLTKMTNVRSKYTYTHT